MTDPQIYFYLKQCDRHTQDSIKYWRDYVDLYREPEHPHRKVDDMARKVFETTWSKVGYILFEKETRDIKVSPPYVIVLDT